MPDIEPKKDDIVDEILATADEAEQPTSETDPDFVFGFTVKVLPNGQGVRFDALETDEYARKATIDDVLGASQAIVSHITTGLIAGRVLQGIQQMQIAKKIKGSVH